MTRSANVAYGFWIKSIDSRVSLQHIIFIVLVSDSEPVEPLNTRIDPGDRLERVELLER